MTRAEIAYTALTTAIANESPPCRGDRRFTADELLPEEMGALQLVCSTCPLFGLCRAYALAARPPAGVWAGERWAEKRRPGRPSRKVSGNG